MATSSRALPDFAAPPVVEVALGLQFDPPIGLTSAVLGRIWELYKSRFPRTEDQPPLPSVLEAADVRAPQPTRLRLMGVPPLPRCWFLNASQSELIQIQDDKFIRNWRKTGEADQYPRYERIRDAFKADYKVFADFVVGSGLGSLQPTQCEVTYVNHIKVGGSWGHGAIEHVLRMW